MAAQISLGSDHEGLFLEYCSTHGVAGAARNYVSCMRRMAKDLGRGLTPADVHSEFDIFALVDGLTEAGLNERHRSNFRTVLRKFQEMCRTNYRCMFDNFVVAGSDVDSDEIPARVLVQVTRIVRDTKLSREVKAEHADTCQICGTRIELPDGRFYSEGHHLKPLGKKHSGPDVKDNILCVCPNCHAKLDFGAMKIDPAKLRKVPGHTVRQQFVDYHNRRCS